MHGKTWTGRQGKANEFHSPTSIELVVKPHYRVFYAGPMAEELSRRLKRQQSQYHTYLGSAYCLTFPRWIAEHELDDPPAPAENQAICCHSVVPSAAVGQLLPKDGYEYARVGGVLWEHIGDRRFRGTTAVIYEVRGRPIEFLHAPVVMETPWCFVKIPDEKTVCLW
jgi:CRISPR-associated protein Cas5h